MIIGIPKEIKNNENRVSLTPSGAKELTKRGHKVYVQATAGANSGFPDKDYVAAGAELLPTIEEVYAKAEMIIKVKEPIEPEYKLIRQGQLVFTYFHFASSEPLTRAMVESGAICCAYETVEASDRSLPLLIPMSEVAGRMATQEGCYFLEKPHGGKGKLLGGMPGVKPAKVFVIGAGVVGTAAARMAAGLGRRRDDLRHLPQASGLPDGRDAPKRKNAYVVGIQHPRRAQDRRPGDRLGADSRCESPETRDARHA